MEVCGEEGSEPMAIDKPEGVGNKEPGENLPETFPEEFNGKEWSRRMAEELPRRPRTTVVDYDQTMQGEGEIEEWRSEFATRKERIMAYQNRTQDDRNKSRGTEPAKKEAKGTRAPPACQWSEKSGARPETDHAWAWKHNKAICSERTIASKKLTGNERRPELQGWEDDEMNWEADEKTDEDLKRTEELNRNEGQPGTEKGNTRKLGLTIKGRTTRDQTAPEPGASTRHTGGKGTWKPVITCWVHLELMCIFPTM